MAARRAGPSISPLASFIRIRADSWARSTKLSGQACSASLWMSPPIPFKAGLSPISFACPDDFSPALVNSVYLCKTAEYGYGVGDWVPAQEGDNNATGGGFSATFDGRNVILAPQTFDVQQYTHRLDGTAFAKLTDEYWSWFFVFVG